MPTMQASIPVRGLRWLLLCGLLLLAQSALAGTGIYWNFLNNSDEDLHLHPQSPDTHGCWDSSQFPADVLLPAHRAVLVYMERTGCIDSDFTVEVSGGAYDGSLARLWTDDQMDTHVPVRRNVHVAHSDHVMRNVLDMAIGTSQSRMTTEIQFTGQGSFDTIAAWVAFAPGSRALPPGSYRDSCVGEVDPASGELHADCRDALGGLRLDSVLGYAALCAPGSTVSNDQGQPLCDQLGQAAPRGSYLLSCVPTNFDPFGGKLQALCADAQGWRQAQTLETFYACAAGSSISNRGGRLSCDRLFLPEGSYRDACPAPRYADGVLQADCRSFVPLPGLRLDYQASCAPYSSVRLDASTNQLRCDTPRRPPPHDLAAEVAAAAAAAMRRGR